MRRLVQAGIVVALLLTCAGLLLPPVAAVRGAAAQMRCCSNGKHLGVAWHNYESCHGHVPPGTTSNPALPPEKRFSWVHPLSPFLEWDFVEKKGDTSLAWDDEKNQPVIRLQIVVLNCPLAPRNQVCFPTSYLGVAGVGPDAVTLPADDPRVGAFGYDRKLNTKEFTDGTGNTMLLLETRSGGPWAQGGPGTVRGLDPANCPHVGDGRPFYGGHTNGGWWERKTRMTTVVMCDGSVRTVSDSVSPEVLEALATVRGKEEVSGEW